MTNTETLTAVQIIAEDGMSDQEMADLRRIIEVRR